MGSSLKSKSTRARSAESSRKPRRKPAPPKPSKVRTATDSQHDTALRQIRNRLEIAMSVAYVTGAALKDQGADVDQEAALALQRCVGDELDQQIERIDSLIGKVTS